MIKIRMKHVIIIIILTVSMMLSVAGRAPATDSNSARSTVDIKQLEGRWVRPDGGYVIELRDIKKDGSVSAAYFNPMPINVYSARVMKKNDGIKLVLELRDVNYPGSKYNLIYDTVTDRLRGTYFQAVEKRTFNVEFFRAR